MTKKMYKVGVIGNRDAILPFRMIGFQTFPVTEAHEAVNQLRQLAMEDFGIIYVTEDIAAAIPETLAHYDNQVLPAIILLPTHRGTQGLGLQRVQDMVEKAVGQNIL
ncbi:UNVERIFIED_CONTAM: V-type ATP synthase subunit F [Streptococcus canis]|nr:V-type ATP synthase subunit F [Streptococcus canis]MDV5972347.1 V-type ATP synthase subunit F [Streptococcus canis]QKG76837.1 V-type ATP synthase subunit F [Streptococcus canis]